MVENIVLPLCLFYVNSVNIYIALILRISQQLKLILSSQTFADTDKTHFVSEMFCFRCHVLYFLFVSLDALSNECKQDRAIRQSRGGIRSRVDGRLWPVRGLEASAGRHRQEGPQHGEEEGKFYLCSSFSAARQFRVLYMNLKKNKNNNRTLKCSVCHEAEN